jgi:MtN3 and saliva related transmembrane protein
MIDSQPLTMTHFLFAEPSAHYLMDLTQIIGFVAGFGTTFAALPDLIAMLKRRSSVGMNPRMAAITGTFQILWVIYGTLIGSRNIVMWNVIAVVTNYLTVGAYLYFRRREMRS